MLPLYVLSPLYVAVIECVPGPPERADALHCASPPLRETENAPEQLICPYAPFSPLSENPTTPVAVEGETVAVNVTDCPDIDGFGLDDTVIVVGALSTVCVRVEDVLPLVLVSPP